MSVTLRWSKLKIKSKNFPTNKLKPQFNGEIFFVYDIESLVIHHFYIEIKSCVMSKLVTKRHREDHEQKHINETRCCYYKKREEFFNSLKQKVVQKDRKFRSKTYNQDDLQILNDDEIVQLNQLLREPNFLTSIKNFYKFIYGSNPSGELYKPKNAPIILDDEGNFDKNTSYFALFFKHYSDFNNNNNNNEYDGIYKNIYKDNDLLDDKNYFDRFKDAPNNSKLYNIYQLFVKLTSNKLSIESGKKVLADIEEYLSLGQINSLVKKEREKMKNIKIDSINILDLDKQMYLDRAHIFPVERIKDKIVKLVNRENHNLTTSDKVKYFLKKITEAHNLIALDKTSHSQFDRNKFTWDSNNGKLVINCCNSPQPCNHISNEITDLPKEKITRDILDNLYLRNSIVKNKSGQKKLTLF